MDYCVAAPLGSPLKLAFSAAGDLAGGGPTPLGVRKANLSTTGQALAEEVALIEQVGNLICLPGRCGR